MRRAAAPTWATKDATREARSASAKVGAGADEASARRTCHCTAQRSQSCRCPAASAAQAGASARAASAGVAPSAGAALSAGAATTAASACCAACCARCSTGSTNPPTTKSARSSEARWERRSVTDERVQQGKKSHKGKHALQWHALRAGSDRLRGDLVAAPTGSGGANQNASVSASTTRRWRPEGGRRELPNGGSSGRSTTSVRPWT